MRQVVKCTSDFGSLFRTARQNSKLSIHAVAEKSGFSYGTVANVELNRGSTRTDTLLAIAEVVGVTIEMTVRNRKVL